MMIVQMDKLSAPSAPSSRERAQCIFEKTVELESKRRKAAQARIPSDPNVWQQIRENYEAIILEDHTFSEQHNIEYTLWQLHYKRIEEFRAHYNAVLASSSSNTAQNVRGPARPDKIAKLRVQFKTFLSEASGFYHDLILKIRSKYGLPLGYFSEEPENQNFADRDGKKSTEVKKGLVSCHRCLIYLGDLARYKGLYGDGDSKIREYAAASSYYLQAASLWPASGNPHHQLAILASYSGDELVAIYRYFRSLAVESPFPTARDNLIVAFEKNRQNYTQLLMVVKDSSRRPAGKGKNKGEGDLSLKDGNMVAGAEKHKAPSADEMLKSFCIRFVRLNGILFTRTSLETFAEVLASVSSGLRELLSSGTEEELKFGADAVDNALFIVRLVSILIFSVHNSKKETEGQTYAEIVQRAVLVKYSFTAIFELLGLVIDWCVQLHDPSSSYFLPGILVFVEWLACCPEVAMGSDLDEKQAAVISNCWDRCIAFFNRVLSLGPMFIDDDEDETFFSNMSKYDERETENRLALWEDYELKGFLPLLPAQTILDFSRKHSFGTESLKEKKARIKRILAAGKALTGVIRIDHNPVYFDSRKKKFLIGVKPSDDVLLDPTASPPKTSEVQDTQASMNLNSAMTQQGQQPYLDEEDEDEVIVFKPVVAEKRTGAPDQTYPPGEELQKPDQYSSSVGDLQSLGGSRSASYDNLLQASGNTSFQMPVSVAGSNLFSHLQPTQAQVSHLQQVQSQAVRLQPAQAQAVGLQPPQSQVGQFQPAQSLVGHLQPSQPQVSRWIPEVAATLTGSLAGLHITGNGHVMKNDMPGNHGISYFPANSLPIHQSFNVNGIGGMPYTRSRTPEAMLPSKIDAVASSGIITDVLGVQTSTRKSPISRPVRPLGPPPGFNPVPSKPRKEPLSDSDLSGNNPLVDDYSWLDGYQPQAVRGIGLGNSLNQLSYGKTEYLGTSNGLTGTVNFPFPGKQVPMPQVQGDMQKVWQNYQQLQQQQLVNGNQQSAPHPEHYQGQSTWPGRYFV